MMKQCWRLSVGRQRFCSLIALIDVNLISHNKWRLEMRTVRFLTLGLFFLPALTLATGCGGDSVPDTGTELSGEDDPTLSGEDDTMVMDEETGATQ
jgi:hypothetical protein